MTAHLPARRTWVCAACRAPWPCRTAREELLAEYADCSAALAIYLGSAFAECAAELHDVPAGDLYLRFLGWLRLRRVTPPAASPDDTLRPGPP